jgi:hypothetical protein
MTSMYAGHGVDLHLISGNAIEEQPCVDNPNGSPAMYCSFPNQPGAVGLKGGLEFLKNSGTSVSGQLLDPASCALDSSCVRRFQYGRKDSYHYALFGHSLGMPGWSFLAGTLQSIGISGTTLTFTTTVPHGLVVSATAANGRVTVGDAVSKYGLNGLYFVQSTPSPTTFTAQLNQSVAPATFSLATDPFLSVTSGQVRSGSGYSDIGGADSLITLGLWGPDGQSLNAQAGTFAHELGHSVALTHGGYYYDQQGTYIPTVEANCKPNYQSVMNYLFQVDLLGPNGVLDYSKFEAVKLVLASEPTSLNGLARSVVALFRSNAEAKGVELSLKLDLREVDSVLTDAQRLKQILLNLIGNAIKFTEQGFVTLTAQSRHAFDDSVEVEFEVRDSGIGIPQQAIADLFQPFHQVIGKESTRPGGTGLGLAISQRIAEAMGGRIEVDSRPGLGSIFTLRLSFPIGRATPSVAADDSAMPGLDGVETTKLIRAR